MAREPRLNRRTLFRWSAATGALSLVAGAAREPSLRRSTATEPDAGDGAVPFHACLKLNGTPLEHASLIDARQAHPAAMRCVAGYEYRVESIEVDLLTADEITLTDGDRPLWGPHRLPAGFGVIPLPSHVDKRRSGLGCGVGCAPRICVAYGANGSMRILGFIVPAESNHA